MKIYDYAIAKTTFNSSSTKKIIENSFYCLDEWNYSYNILMTQHLSKFTFLDTLIFEEKKNAYEFLFTENPLNE